MAGPIRTFIDTLQERQPLRNALRGVLGMPQRRGTVIDSFEEMASRDREMGGDISDPYPKTRMDPRIASTATAGPGVTAGLPAAPEMIATPAPVDQAQPLAGMGMMQGMVTPPSQAMRQRGGVPARQVSQQGGDLSASTRAISQSGQNPEDQAFAQAQLYYNSALQPGLDPDRRKAFMKVAGNFHEQYMSMFQTRTGNELMAGVSADSTKAAEVASASAAAQGLSSIAQIEAGGKAQIEVNKALMLDQQALSGRAAGAADELAPLVANPNLSLTNNANAARSAMAAASMRYDKSRDTNMEQQEYDRVFELGMSKRLSQYSAEDSPAIFDRLHPTFPEVANHFRQQLAANPKNYDLIYAKVRGIVAASTGPQYKAAGKPGDVVQRYIDGVTNDILGPKPPSQFSILDLNPFGRGK